MKTLSYGYITGAFLLLSILSGFVVAYQYEPATPFVSSVAIETILPFGSFWRSVHFWTSQAFVIFLMLHVFDLRNKVSHGRASFRLRFHWTWISISVAIAIYALFSGYVLRYDATGQAAGAIAEHLFLRIPMMGSLLNKVLLNISGDGLNRIYAVHILAGFVCWLMATWYHLRRVPITFNAFTTSVTVSAFFCFLLKAPIDQNISNTHLIKGPWFFLGIQELLRYFDPLLAGIVVPAIPLVVLFLFPWVKKTHMLYLIILLWTFGYAEVTLISLLRTG